MAKQTHVKAEDTKGSQLQLVQHDTDSPLLPVAQLEKLHAFRPDLVDWVCKQTELEAQSRRERQKRLDRFVLTERISGQLAGTLIAFIGIGASVLLAFHGQREVASILGGGTLIGLVTVLVQGRKTAQAPNSD